MEMVSRHKLLIAGIALILGALFIAAISPAASVLARNTSGQLSGQNHCQAGTQSNGGMTGGGMMGNGGMMGGRSMGQMMGDVDRHFIEQMIPHHQNAIDMADLALQKSQRPEIQALATDIKRVQHAEIDQMRAWYKGWYGADVPADTVTGMMGNGARGMMGGGMMGAMDMTMDLDALANAEDFDRAFIEMMIPHHRMALMMSNMVLVQGEQAELRTLAQSIITGQSVEIEQMEAWYSQWYGARVQ